MTPEHALVQLLKLEALDIDGIKLYTGWTHEKATETIEKCKASGAIAWKHKPSRYEVPAVRKSQRITELQRLSTDLPKLWSYGLEVTKSNADKSRIENSEAAKLAERLRQAWAFGGDTSRKIEMML